MPRPKRDLEATAEMGERVAALRRAKTSTPKDIELWAYANLGGMRVSDESVRKALAGQIDPAQCALELLMALCAFYGVDPADLGPVAERRLQPVLAFAQRDRRRS